MINRPSNRRRSRNEPLGLNLVPLLDALVTLISFLIYSMSFLAIVSIDSPVPFANEEINRQRVDKRPLQLTVSVEKDETKVWSPFDRIGARTFRHDKEGVPDMQELHARIVEIKERFPKETTAVLVPDPAVTYDVIVSVMDAIRTVEPSDPPIYVTEEETGVDREATQLFPDIVFGNILGDI